MTDDRDGGGRRRTAVVSVERVVVPALVALLLIVVVVLDNNDAAAAAAAAAVLSCCAAGRCTVHIITSHQLTRNVGPTCSLRLIHYFIAYHSTTHITYRAYSIYVYKTRHLSTLCL